MTLEQVKSYLRVDGTDSDSDIEGFILAATKHINGQTGKTKVIVIDVDTGKPIFDEATGLPQTMNISTDPLYTHCVKMLCAHWYENRGVEIAGSLTKITRSVDDIVNHIAMSGDYV